MGNGSSSTWMSTMYEQWTQPEYHLKPNEVPKFDPLMGAEDRKQKVSKLTEEEMRLARITPDQRDYCAHLLVDYLRCIRPVFPWVTKCNHERHVYDECLGKDLTDRMKEYERERRMRKREARLKAKSTPPVEQEEAS